MTKKRNGNTNDRYDFGAVKVLGRQLPQCALQDKDATNTKARRTVVLIEGSFDQGVSILAHSIFGSEKGRGKRSTWFATASDGGADIVLKRKPGDSNIMLDWSATSGLDGKIAQFPLAKEADDYRLAIDAMITEESPGNYGVHYNDILGLYPKLRKEKKAAKKRHSRGRRSNSAIPGVNAPSASQHEQGKSVTTDRKRWRVVTLVEAVFMKGQVFQMHYMFTVDPRNGALVALHSEDDVRVALTPVPGKRDIVLDRSAEPIVDTAIASFSFSKESTDNSLLIAATITEKGPGHYKIHCDSVLQMSPHDDTEGETIAGIA